MSWYLEHRRSLPWHKKKALPYEVWISELMSQQSTMPTVIRYFQKWVKLFPDVHALASSTEEEVLNAWQGLGYYSRARNALKAAQLLSQELKKKKRWPRDYKYWLSLPGVGAYTAKAVTSICFDQKLLPKDGNVIRVLSRFHKVLDPHSEKRDADKIDLLLDYWAEKAPEKSHGTLAQALMELGSQVCKPQAQAQCELCPLVSSCEAYENELHFLIPKKKKRPEEIKIDLLCLGYSDAKGRLLVRKRPQNMRLGGQWEFPHLELSAGVESIGSLLGPHFELKAEAKHKITRYNYSAFFVSCGPWKGTLPKDHVFIDAKKAEQFEGTLSTLTKKLLIELDKREE